MRTGADTRPIIGLTTYLQQASSGVWDVPASFLPESYLNGVTNAGGIAILLPPQATDESRVLQVLDGLDGLIITGGQDVDPSMYGQARHPRTGPPAADRDGWEFALTRAALARDIPLLGICRGAQVLNAALGGTLHQHLPDLLGHTRHQAGNALFTTTLVRPVSGTKVEHILGGSHHAQCYHHQAIAELGQGLIVSALDEEGVVEAVELDPQADTESWVVGVQWHPEQSQDDLRLFAGLVEAAQARSLKVPSDLR